MVRRRKEGIYAYAYRSGNMTFTTVSTPFRNRRGSSRKDSSNSGCREGGSAWEDRGSVKYSLEIDCGPEAVSCSLCIIRTGAPKGSSGSKLDVEPELPFHNRMGSPGEGSSDLDDEVNGFI